MTGPEDNRLTAHGGDGIRECDKASPPWWWKAMFLVCVLGAIGYWFYDHDGPHADEKTPNASVARQRAPMDEQALAKLAADPAVLKVGKAVYQSRCASCHRHDGGGQVGPNLTDGHQIHGSTALDIHNTIRIGVPSKGMIAWEPVLKPDELDAATAYVVTMIGKNVEGGKVAEGKAIPRIE